MLTNSHYTCKRLYIYECKSSVSLYDHFKSVIMIFKVSQHIALVSIFVQIKFLTYVMLNVSVSCDLPPGRLSDSDANSD